jgi:two-component system, LuxR family, sensor kinase FixL
LAGWGIAVGSADGTTLEMVNPAYARMHGYTVEELTGRPILDMYHSEWRAEAVERIRTHTEQDRVMFESTHLHKNGSTFPVLVDVSIVRDRQNCVSHRIVYTQDISERKSLEAHVLEISERERQRIGQDLHDGLCQQLAAITYLCNAARETVVHAAPEPAAMLDRAVQLLQNTMAQAHGLARGLHPVHMEADGLMAALQHLACYYRQVYQVSAHFVCSAPVLVEDNAVATHFYRITQEAMHNALKHGQATRIIVRLSATPAAITLSVTDNGRGFPQDLRKHTGLGLETMRFRARAMGGVLEVHPGEEGGTRVTCSRPNRADAPASTHII